jgi:hypothetical protein
VRPVASELSGAWCFRSLVLGIREEGGRDPNERLDNQNHPEDTLGRCGSRLDIGYRDTGKRKRADSNRE